MVIFPIAGGILYAALGLFLWWLTQGHLLTSDWVKPIRKKTDEQAQDSRLNTLTWQKLCWPVALVGLVASVVGGGLWFTESYYDFNSSTELYTRQQVEESSIAGIAPWLFFSLLGLVAGIILYLGPVALKEFNYRFDKSLQR